MNDLSHAYLAARAASQEAQPAVRRLPAWLAVALETEFGPLAPQIATLWAARHPWALREDGASGLEARHEEYADLLALLLDHAGTDDAHSAALARWIALSCCGDDHLWEDLGLPERPALGALIARRFPALHAKNIHQLRWKRFFYKQLCDRAEVRLCRAPSCAECAEYAGCFEGGTDTSQR